MAARKRSPNFPYVGVRECIEYLTKLYGQTKTTKAPIILAYGHMGLSPKSSTSDRIRASMSSYGLIEEEIIDKEKFIRVSDLLFRIIKETRENLRLASIREAALNDAMMRKLWNGEWKRGLPNDDATIISILQLEHGFTEEAAKRFTGVLKDNYRFCELATYYEVPEDDVEESDGGEEVPPPPEITPPAQDGQQKPPKPLSGLVQYPIPLDDGQLAYISLPSSITENDAEFVPDFVNLLLKKLRRKAKNNG